MIDIKPECMKCQSFNPGVKDQYRCACRESCPGLDGEKEFREGRLFHRLNPDTEPNSPYKLGTVEAALWWNGWTTN
jgi:hypothetical protein